MSAQLNAIITLTASLTKSEVEALCAHLSSQIEVTPKKTKKRVVKKESPYKNVAPLY